MTPAQHEVVRQEVEQAAKVLVSRWPGVRYDDAVQQGWVVALETLPRADNTQTLGAFIGGALRRSMLNFAYRVTTSVHYPKNKEYQYATGAAFTPAPVDCLESELAPVGYDAMHLRDALMDAVYRLTPVDCPIVFDVRAVLLGLRTEEDQARLTGWPRHRLEARAKILRARLATDPDLQEYL